MSTLLLIVIYITFISLGLPDALLGSAWPVMYLDLNVAETSAGILSMTIAGGTIISSLFSSQLLEKFGTYKITLFSVLLTALALIGFFIFPNFISIWLLCIPLGIGAGAIDSGLNNFVAHNYNALQMSWLHSFWGVGATIGPYIISFFIAKDNWKMGYLVVGIIQFGIFIMVLLSRPLWKKDVNKEVNDKSNNKDKPEPKKILTNKELIKIPYMKLNLIVFLCYCAVESIIGLWGSSYLVNIRSQTPDIAAKWVALFFLGITIGRFISGIATKFLTSKQLVRFGQVTIIIGVILLLPIFHINLSIIGLILAGFGCAPIYPTLLFETKNKFGEENSQSIIGLQMAIAYTGTTFMPPLFGYITKFLSFSFFSVFILLIAITMLISEEFLNKSIK